MQNTQSPQKIGRAQSPQKIGRAQSPKERVAVYVGDVPLPTKNRIVSIHTTIGTDSVAYAILIHLEVHHQRNHLSSP